MMLNVFLHVFICQTKYQSGSMMEEKILSHFKGRFVSLFVCKSFGLGVKGRELTRTGMCWYLDWELLSLNKIHSLLPL